MSPSRIAARWCLAAAAAAALAGCAVAPLRPPADAPRAALEERVRAMQDVDEWEVRGRLAVRTSKRGETVSMYWRRDGGHHDISLYGPLGAGGVALTQDEDGAVLRDSKDRTYEDDSAEVLLRRVMGWRVPFRNMQHWVLGVPAPGEEYDMELDQWGRLTSLTQNGWRIRFQEYHFEEGRDLPRRLVMNALPGTEHIAGGEPGENETIQVKALIKRWDWPGN